MYLREPCFDIDELVKENLHVHTPFSGCAKPEMRVKAIVKRAEELNLERVALVDHFNHKNTPMVEKNIADRFIVELTETKIPFLYGAELSVYGVGKWLDSDETNAALDYRLYAANHYHLDFWEQPNEKTPRGYAEHTVKVLEALIKACRADCIAHPIHGGYVEALPDKNSLAAAVTDEELYTLMLLAKKHKVAWEINIGEALMDPELTKRLWRFGKEIGSVFHFGTDAHRIENMDTRAHIDELRRLLP